MTALDELINIIAINSNLRLASVKASSMTKTQLDACRKRNEKLRQGMEDGESIAMSRVKQAVDDIDGLLIDLDTMTNRARMGQEENDRLRSGRGVEEQDPRS